jgi:hypothetical protein
VPATLQQQQQPQRRRAQAQQPDAAEEAADAAPCCAALEALVARGFSPAGADLLRRRHLPGVAAAKARALAARGWRVVGVPVGELAAAAAAAQSAGMRSADQRRVEAARGRAEAGLQRRLAGAGGGGHG